jgi:peptidyl-prolyl cis-trans isomerase C
VKKRLFGSIVLIVTALCVGIACAAPAEQPAAPPERDPEKVLAKLEGQEIKEKDIDQVIQMLGPQGASYNSEQGRIAILNELVAARVFALSGTKQGLDKAPEYKAAMDNFSSQTLARLAIEKTLNDINASDEDAQKLYDEHPGEFTTQAAVHASHIRLPDDAASADKIALIQGELKKGTSFDVLATEHSIDPSAAQNGGDLDFFSRGQMVPEFEDAAFALKEPGDISAPVKTTYGWHIIRLEEKRTPGVVPYDEVKPQILQYLTNEKRNQKYQEELEKLKKDYKVEITGAPASTDEK